MAPAYNWRSKLNNQKKIKIDITLNGQSLKEVDNAKEDLDSLVALAQQIEFIDPSKQDGKSFNKTE